MWFGVISGQVVVNATGVSALSLTARVCRMMGRADADGRLWSESEKCVHNGSGVKTFLRVNPIKC